MTRHLLLSAAAVLALAGCNSSKTPTSPATETIVMKITPDSTTLSPNQAKTFIATPRTGTVPTGAKYVWVVLGTGKLSAALGDSVTYTASAGNGVDTLTVQLLDATSQPIGAGATPIRTASATLLAVAVNPLSPHVEVQTGAGVQVMTVTATTGSLPVNATYAWTVVGSGRAPGKFSSTSSTSATTTVNQVTYVSPDSATTDTLTVQVKNANGAVVGTASTPIIVFPGLVWSNTGSNAQWSNNNYGDGNYTSPGGGMARVDAASFPGEQQIACVYQNQFPRRLSSFQQFNFYIYAAAGARLAVGSQFVQSSSSGTTVGALSVPQVSGVNTITLNVTNVLTQSDGADFVTFTFTTSGNQSGYTGTMSGTGQCVVRYPG